jgi:hypothetical protein
LNLFSFEDSSLSYKGNSKSNYGSQRHNRSIQSVQNARSSHARNLDSHFKAKLAKSPEQWMNYPSRFDLPEVDAPKPKEEIAPVQPPRQIWKKRELVGNMTDQEISDYEAKLNKFAERYTYRSRMNPGVEKIFMEREKVIEEREKRQEDKRQHLLQLVRNDMQLFFDDIPDENPFPLHMSYDSRGHLIGDNTDHKTLEPYIEAKEKTKEIKEIIKAYGGTPKENEILQNYVEHYKKDDYYKAKDPYDIVYTIKNQAEELEPKIKNIIESKADPTGAIDSSVVFNAFKTEDARAVTMAIKNIAEKESYQQKGKTILLERPNQKEKPDTQGLTALDNLGAFTRNKRNETSEAILANMEDGKAKVRFMNNARTAMFDGEVDLSALPGMKSQKGERVIRLDGGDEIALSNPSFGYTNKDGQLVLKKTNVKSTRKEYEEGDYWKKKPPKILESRITKEFKVNVHPLDPKAKDDYIQPPMPKLNLNQEFTLTAHELAELARPSKKTSKDKYAPQDFTNVIKFYTKNGKTTVSRLANRENEDDKIRHLYKQTKNVTVSGDNKAKAAYTADYLYQLSKALRPGDEIKFAYTTDMPLKAEISNPTVKGTFYLAPRIETD